MTELVIVLLILVVLSIEDIRWKEVHAALLLAFFIAGCLYYLIVRQFDPDVFLGGIVTGALITLLSLLSKEKIGSADGIVFASTGAFLGLYENLALILLSLLSAGIGGGVMAFIFKRKGGESLPLIPFIAVGTAILAGTKL
ncbi:MAG: prepilin peptidase [Candidatus Weimeria sp.]